MAPTTDPMSPMKGKRHPMKVARAMYKVRKPMRGIALRIENCGLFISTTAASKTSNVGWE